MATMFGRFEIQSDLSKSETALIYKALDMETNQVVALKTQSLRPLGDRADVFVETLLAESDGASELVGQNIVALYGAGPTEGQFCAAMEYIQGNSIATMLARKEGFSIWDLLDISRQICAGLEMAAAKGVAHHSLEPAKIMVQWDGMVKLLGYGISYMSLIEAEAGNGLGRLTPYCSPEQIRGETIDQRSNLFTLGTILYEMVVSRKAFDAADPGTLLGRIENEMPASPCSVNAKIQPAVSELIMKALAKDPAERYQSARELLEDLEKCKENKKSAPDAKRPAAGGTVVVDPAARAAAASKFVASMDGPVAPVASAPVAPARPVAPAPPRMPAAASGNKAAAAAAGAGNGGRAAGVSKTDFNSNFNSQPGSKSGAGLINDFEVSSPETQTGRGAVMSSAVVEPEAKPHRPRVAVDPLMGGPAPGSSVTSFSELAEMPPLKEAYVEPSIPEAAEAPRPVVQIYPKKEEKPRIQPREVAEKAFSEIATIPPRLMLFSILGAVGLILVIAILVFFHVRSEDDGSTAAPRPTKEASSASSEPVAPAPAPVQAARPVPAPVLPPMEAEPDLNVRPVERRNARNRRPAAPARAARAAVIPGQALIDSTPQGAPFQVDGRSDPSWVTPFTVAGLSPGKHIVSINKSGYSSDVRSVEVAAGSRSSLVLHLSPMNALVAVNSTPAGASVVIDGKPTGRVTPAQFAVEKGSHTIFLRKQGYLDETTVADLGAGQNFQFAPVLRALGNVEDMKTVGKFNKLFGHGGDSTAGMGAISIHTQPKGAQVAINQRVLDKLSPVDVMLGPGNYIVDVTLTGFKPVHKIVSVDKGGKVAIDETMERQ